MTAQFDVRGDFFAGKVLEVWFGPNLLEVYIDGRHGASRQTLERRARYGGRKGRSAARRLWQADASWRSIVAYVNRRYRLEV